MKKAFLLALLFFYTTILSAQFENRLWMMGYDNYTSQGFGGFNIDFIWNQPDTISIQRAMNIGQGTSNICDKSGNFLFATNGAKIMDASNQIMSNGFGLTCLSDCDTSRDGNFVHQSNIIIPDPADTNKYYIFYTTNEDYFNFPEGAALYPAHLFYAVVDMSLNGGLGEVISKNVVLLNEHLNIGKLNACKHANGRDWWLVLQKFNAPIYYSFLISPSGIQLINTLPCGMGGHFPGTTSFSPDGNHYLSYDFLQGLQVFSFDRCSGVLSPEAYVAYVDTPDWGFGASFSPNSRFIYTTTVSKIFQYDLWASNVAASKALVGLWDGFYDGYPYGTQFLFTGLARDGKIYVVTGNSTHYLHRINQPDLAGSACDFQQRFVVVPTWYWRSIPNHPNYQLAEVQGSPCDTLTNINHNYVKLQIELFPNPVKQGNKLFIQFNKVSAESAKVEIIDAFGKIILSANTSSYSSLLEFQIPDISPGLYFVKMNTEKQSTYKPLIIL